jgi:hydrogenase maturation protease
VSEPRPLLVLGVGNVFYGDEGAGVHLVHHLRSKYAFPPHVTVMDGGTLGWQLLHHIAEYDRVVLVDAVAAPPGKVYCFGRSDVPDEIGYGKLSSHEWEVPDLLTAMDLYGDLPEVTIVAIGVDPLGFGGGDVGVRLSPHGPRAHGGPGDRGAARDRAVRWGARGTAARGAGRPALHRGGDRSGACMSSAWS